MKLYIIRHGETQWNVFTANAVDGFVKKILKNLDRNLQVTLRS